jgi:acyl-CoA dehydrogenase
VRTEDDPELPQSANSAFIVDIPSEGWTEVREVETMHGSTGHSEILSEDLRVPADKMLGGRGEGHLLGSRGWGRPAWPPACAGPPRPRWPWT